jgi:hypothetical protein
MSMLNLQFTGWDALLLVAVTLMGTAVAYLHHPKWKAVIYSMPIPFTVATLSLGRGVDATNLLGLVFLLMFAHGVRTLYGRLKWPIVASILLPAVLYAGVAAWVAPRVPRSDGAFWVSAVAVFLLALVLYRAMPHREEAGHRTPLPVWVKVPLIAAVVLLLIVGKKVLQGFMTTFPMVSLLAAYESRHSLWTMCRQFAAFTLCLVPMMGAMRVVEPWAGLGWALAVGWVVYGGLMYPFTRARWEQEA